MGLLRYGFDIKVPTIIILSIRLMIAVGRPTQVDVRVKTRNEIYKTSLVKNQIKAWTGIIKNAPNVRNHSNEKIT